MKVQVQVVRADRAYRATVDANAAYADALVRAYGEDRACEARHWPDYEHTDLAVLTARAKLRAARREHKRAFEVRLAYEAAKRRHEESLAA